MRTRNNSVFAHFSHSERSVAIDAILGFHYENRKISIKVDQKCKRAASIYLLSPGSRMEFLFEEELGLCFFSHFVPSQSSKMEFFVKIC